MGSLGRRLIALAVVAAVPTACGLSGEMTKAGGAPPPIVLRLGADDPEPDLPAAQQMAEFARRVEELSEGTIRIDVVLRAAGPGADWDQRNGRMVMSGELDMGNIPTRAWDTEGVTSMRALSAPFLITSEGLLHEVVSSSLADEMLDGLESVGLVGLALLPEGLRHPFGFDGPLLGPEDYRGRTIRTPTSATVAALFAALGAETTDDALDATIQAGMESSYFHHQAGTATGNVTFFPKVNALVINADVYAGLTEPQREILRQAAVDTRDWSIANLPTDGEAAAAFCGLDRAIVHADDTVIAALEQAVAPMYAEFESDEQTRSLIDRIRRFEEAIVAAAPPEPCGGAVLEERDPDATAADVIDGVYRHEITDEDLIAAGVTDADFIAENRGVWTWTFTNGRWCFDQDAPNLVRGDTHLCGPFRLEGDLLTIVFGPEDEDVYRWTLTPAGDLDLDLVFSEYPGTEAWLVRPWIRIADPETADAG